MRACVCALVCMCGIWYWIRGKRITYTRGKYARRFSYVTLVDDAAATLWLQTQQIGTKISSYVINFKWRYKISVVMYSPVGWICATLRRTRVRNLTPRDYIFKRQTPSYGYIYVRSFVRSSRSYIHTYTSFAWRGLLLLLICFAIQYSVGCNEGEFSTKSSIISI